MKRSFKRFVVSLLSVVFLISIFGKTFPYTGAIVCASGNVNTFYVNDGVVNCVEGAQQSYIFYGSYEQTSSGNNSFNKDPIKWRVLQNANGQLFVLSDQILDFRKYETNRNVTSITWAQSNIRSWLNGNTDYKFLHDAFCDLEKQAIEDTNVVNQDNPLHGTNGGNDTTDKIFLLSIDDILNTEYGFSGTLAAGTAQTRVATDTAYTAYKSATQTVGIHEGTSDFWWLRSPGQDSICAALIGSLGEYLDNHSAKLLNGIRPAMNIDLSSVLLVSAAEGGKNSGNIGSNGLVVPNSYSGNEWKLTILDSTRSFAASRIGEDSLEAGSALSFSYSGATVGTNEYISGAILDTSGNILYYGHILAKSSGSANGTASITIPSGLSDGVYTLKLFSEQCNGDFLTDYASSFSSISITVGNVTPASYSVTVTNDGNGTGSASSTSATSGTEITLSASPSTGYQFKEWQVISGGVTVNNNSFTMPDNAVEVKAIFEAVSDPGNGAGTGSGTGSDNGTSTNNSENSSSNNSSNNVHESSSNETNHSEEIEVLSLNISIGSSSSGDYKLHIEGQGPLYQEVVKLFMPIGYSELQSVNILTLGSTDRELKKGIISFKIPEIDRKLGRVFAIFAVDKYGIPHIYMDTDLNDDTITVDVDYEGYAFSIIYSDIPLSLN